MAQSTVIGGFYKSVSPYTGMIRKIFSTGTTPAPESISGYPTGLTSDPIGFSFNTPAGMRTMVVERVYNGNCKISTYDSNWNLKMSASMKLYDGSTSEYLKNIYTIVGVTTGTVTTIYGTDYSMARVFKATYDTSGTTETFTVTAHYTFSAATTSGNAAAYPVALALDSSENVYAVAQQYLSTGYDPGDYTYYPSTVVKLNSSLVQQAIIGPDGTNGTTPPSGVTWPAPNAFDIQGYDGNYYITAIGGPQWYGEGTSYPNTVEWNEESRIQKMTPSMVVSNLIRPANSSETNATDDKFDMRALAILSDGTAYALTGDYYTLSYDASTYTYTYRFNGRIWKTTVTDLNNASDDLIGNVGSLITGEGVISAQPGYLWTVLPAEELSKIWGMLGDTLGIYSDSGISGSAIDADTASGNSNETFNTLNLVLPATVSRGISVVRTVRGFVHPVMAYGMAMEPEKRKKFIEAHLSDK